MIEVYSKDGCSSCVSARSLLTAHGLQFIEKKLGRDFTREWLLETYPNARTFPVIVVDGFNIGGFVQLTEMIDKIVGDKRQLLSE